MTETIAAAGVIVSVLVVYVQVHRQQRATLRVQAEHLKDQIKVQVFQEVAKQLHRTGRALGRASSQAVAAVQDLEYRSQGRAVDDRRTSQYIRRVHHRAMHSLTDLALLFEKYEIVFARFVSIRKALADCRQQITEISFDIVGRAILFLPNEDLPRQLAAHAPTPTAEDLRQYRILVERYRELLSELQGYILDCMVESQNELLGNLFSRELPPRNPLDKSVRVVTRDAEVPSRRPEGAWI